MFKDELALAWLAIPQVASDFILFLCAVNRWVTWPNFGWEVFRCLRSIQKG